MTFLVISFVAGVLTVLAPCILPVLPVVVGTAAAGRSRSTPYVVVASLAVSVIAFTYLLKASAALVDIPPEVWTYLSGGILTLFGLVLVFPALWESLPGMNKVSAGSNQLMGQGFQRKSIIGDVLVGAALGPIFSTCSPTYFVILASVLPASFALGTLYLFAYVIGLSLVLLLIAILGQRFAEKLAWASDPRGWFKRVLGVLFIILGVSIVFGLEKKLETAILNTGFLDITRVEQVLLSSTDTPMEDGQTVPYTEIVNPSGFINTPTTSSGEASPITIGQFVGKKVILIDFMTYSCINCQRTIPYLNAWYEKYKDQGLEIIAIHTPEFAFEHDINNVRNAIEQLGIKYPVVLDNDYSTWRAYGNQFWPRKYLIDIHGNVVYDHIGEGSYDEIEMKIQELLAERAQLMGEAAPDSSLAADQIEGATIATQSPETYFGSARNEYLGNGTPSVSGEQNFTLPSNGNSNTLYLSGTWNVQPEYAEAASADSRVVYRYSAKNVYIVADSDTPADMEVWQDGTLVKTVTVKTSTLYTLISDENAGAHTLELRVPAGVRLYAFTFG